MKAMATNQTISWFYQRFKEGSLELSASFQRNPVWLQRQKDYLIETILLELPVPEIYVINRVNPAGETKWIVVDGQQRLRTVLEFVQGELTISISEDAYKHIKTFSNLSDEGKTQFWRFPMVVRDLEDSTNLNVRDLFERLNKWSTNLNDQELRNARFSGQFLEAVQEIGNSEFWTGSGIFSLNDIRRMIDLEFIGVLLSTMIGGIYNRKDRLDEFYTNYDKEFEDRTSYVNRFERNLSFLETVLPKIKSTRWKNKADFYTLFLFADSSAAQFSDASGQNKLSEGLSKFEENLSRAKEDPDKTEKDYTDYLDASSYGSNDKEKRVRRSRILKQVLLNPQDS